MGGDDSQKLLPWRGIHSSPGRKPPAQLRINNVTETAGWNLARGTPSFWPRPQVQTAWVTFGKQRRVNSAARRRGNPHLSAGAGSRARKWPVLVFPGPSLGLERIPGYFGGRKNSKALREAEASARAEAGRVAKVERVGPKDGGS